MANENQSTGTPDWLLPFVLIVIALLTGLAGWGIFEATRGGDAEDNSAARQLELYTACLNDHGANVPLVETRSDGGFAIIVPGSLLEGDIDLEAWMVAREECQPLEPDPLQLLAGLDSVDLSDLGSLFGTGLHESDKRPQLGPRIDPQDLRRLCIRLEHGDVPEDIDRRELREMCELFDA